MYFFVTSGSSSRNYCDSHVLVCYFSRELFPDASLAVFEGSWGRLSSLCVFSYQTLRSSWLFPVSNINCNWLQDCLKTQLIKCFPSTLHRSNIKTQQLQYRSFWVWELSWLHRSRKAPFRKMFPVHTRISPVWGAFSKGWLSVDGGPNCSDKAAFSAPVQCQV